MSKPKSKGPVIPMPMSERESVRLEKISNGFLAHHSSEGPKGYQTKTVFHPEKPKISIAPVKKGKK